MLEYSKWGVGGTYVNRIKQLRIEKGMTQTQLGNILNVQDSAISKYESEKIPLTADTIKEISKIFNVTIDYLLGVSNTPHKAENITSQSISNNLISSNEEVLLRIFRKLQTETYQEKAINQFKGYVDCLVEVESSTEELGKVVQSTPSKKNVG